MGKWYQSLYLYWWLCENGLEIGKALAGFFPGAFINFLFDVFILDLKKLKLHHQLDCLSSKSEGQCFIFSPWVACVFPLYF